MKTFKHGLVVGKFCPLHNGHVYVIEEATLMCQQVTIISYTSEYNELYPVANRRMWLTTLFPNANVIVPEDGFPHDAAPDIEHRQFCFELLQKLNLRVDVVFGSEEYIPGFADYLIADYVMVDLERKRFPISGTKIRDGVQLISHTTPAITRQFIGKRIAFIGGESSGKTTMCQLLTREFNKLYTRAENIREYGRDWYEIKKHKLEFEDMLYIGKSQVVLEENAMSLGNYAFMFCDTTPFVTKTYSEAWFGKVDPELEILAKRKYDYVFMCMRDFPFINDGTRSTAEFSEWQQGQYLHAYPNAILLNGTIEERLDKVCNYLRRDA